MKALYRSGYKHLLQVPANQRREKKMSQKHLSRSDIMILIMHNGWYQGHEESTVILLLFIALLLFSVKVIFFF